MTNQERYTDSMLALEGMDILGIYADMSKCQTD